MSTIRTKEHAPRTRSREAVRDRASQTATDDGGRECLSGRVDGIVAGTTIDWRTVPQIEWDGPPSSLPDPGSIRGLVDFDTETSGLHPDDGARVSTVSVAWIEWGSLNLEDGGWYGQGGPVIRYTAWPFAQGKSGKQDDDGQRDLFGSEESCNLDKAEWFALIDWLLAVGDGLSGHNIKFDVTMMRAGVDGLREGTEGWVGACLLHRVRWDTQVAAKELWPTQPTALKGTGSLSARLWGKEDKEKQALKGYLGPKDNPRYDLVPWDVMYLYAAADAADTCRVRMLEVEAIERGEVAQGGASGRWWVQRERRVLHVLSSMERRGLPYDAAGSQLAAQECSRRQTEEREALPFDVRVAKRYYFERDRTGTGVLVPDGRRGYVKGLELEPYAVTEKKRDPQMTAEVLDDMVKDNVPHAEALQRYNKLETARSMWYTAYAAGVGSDGRLRTVFRQVASGFEGEGGTRSGRFSVERVNLQAIPHDYRLGGEEGVLHGLPTPRALIGAAMDRLTGWQGWEFDLAQAELRVAAMWADCKLMLEAIRNGDDLHGLTANSLFGVNKGDGAWGEMRQVAKRGNFSLIFGSGWLTFQRMVKKETGIRLSDSEAQRIVYEWNQLYPEFRRAIDRHAKTVEWGERGAQGMPLVNGRVRWWRAFEDTHKAFNQRVQASLAELGKDWMVATEQLGQEWDLDARGIKDGVGPGGLLLTIHDSQVWLLPDRGAKRMAARIEAEGVRIWNQLFPGVPGGVDAKRWGVAA